MDPQRFDAVAKAAGARAGSRRAAVRGLAGGALGALLAGLGRGAADAAKQCKKVRRGCSDNAECCGTLVCKRANSQHSCGGGGRKCCKKIDEDCNDGCECCGIDVICNGGRCDRA